LLVEHIVDFLKMLRLILSFEVAKWLLDVAVVIHPAQPLALPNINTVLLV
jgi:hypothetical protein